MVGTGGFIYNSDTLQGAFFIIIISVFNIGHLWIFVKFFIFCFNPLGVIFSLLNREFNFNKVYEKSRGFVKRFRGGKLTGPVAQCIS